MLKPTLVVPNAHSYATREKAVAKLTAVLTKLGIEDKARCLILAQENGRFSPAVLLVSIDPSLMLPLCGDGIAVIG